MEKLGFSLQEHYALPKPEVIDLLADAGFCAVSLSWQQDDDPQETLRQVRERNLTVQSLHGPLRGMPAMWHRDPSVAGPILQALIQSARDCARFSIPLLVVHPWNGVDYTFPQEALCFDHFDALVRCAENSGICIAFENLEGPEFLAALMARYSTCNAVGFCWDSGHELCYAPDWDFLSRYGDRLLMTHLNDNFGITDPAGHPQGTDDLHLLPYDGIADWDQMVQRLKKSRRQEILNFELKIRPKGDRCVKDLYSKMPLAEYFTKAYETARRAVAGYFK